MKLANEGEVIVMASGRQRKPVARIVAAELVEKKGRVSRMFEGAPDLGDPFFNRLPEDELRFWKLHARSAQCVVRVSGARGSTAES